MAGKRKPIEFEVDSRGCHICTSHAPNTHGYPQLWWSGQNNNMHRVLYIEAHGDPGPGILIRHSCDNRMCINLEHLIPGSGSDNNADATERKRWNPRRGERVASSKLSADAARKIKKSGGTQRDIATAFGVNQSQVSRIKSGDRWAHIQGD